MTTNNPFLQATLPTAAPWDSEKQRWWAETRRLGRWSYGLHRVKARSTVGRLVSIVSIFIGVLLLLFLPVLFDLPERALRLFTWDTLHTVLAIALWFVPTIAALFVLTGFIEGWMRWQLYEQIAVSYAGPPYIPSALVVGGRRRFALLNPRLAGELRAKLISFDGHVWQTHYTSDNDQPLVDLALLPDKRLMLTRVGGDLIVLDAEGAAQVTSMGMEGEYIVAAQPNRYLIAGTPFSLWFDPTTGGLQRLEVVITGRPALHEGIIYLLDDEHQCVMVLQGDAITTIPLAKGTLVNCLAVAPNGTLFIGEQTGSKRDCGRVLRYAGGRWLPVGAQFKNLVFDLALDGEQLLAHTVEGVYCYDPRSDSWECEEVTGFDWQLAKLGEQLFLLSANTGAILTRLNGRWQTEPLVLPLDGKTGKQAF